MDQGDFELRADLLQDMQVSTPRVPVDHGASFKKIRRMPGKGTPAAGVIFN
jgi:hypothetical protein